MRSFYARGVRVKLLGLMFCKLSRFDRSTNIKYIMISEQLKRM